MLGVTSQLLCHLLRSGNRLNHHPHHAALYRCPLARELVQFRLVPIKRVNFFPYDQRVLRPFLHAFSGALSRTLVLFHVVSATRGVADSSGQRFWRCRSLRWLARPRGARRHVHLSAMSMVENVRNAMVFTTVRLVFISIPLLVWLKFVLLLSQSFTSFTPRVPAATCRVAELAPSSTRRTLEPESVRESWT